MSDLTFGIQSMMADQNRDRPDRPMWFVFGQGGGWLGIFTLPVWVHLTSGSVRHPSGEDRGPDVFGGTSVNALQSAAAAQNDLELVDGFWAAINDHFPYDGISGYTKLSLCEGIWSMKPLHRKIDEIIDLDKVTTPCHVGIVTKRPAYHFSVCSEDAEDSKQWGAQIAASAAIATVFEPVTCRIGTAEYSGFDGGHLLSVPWIPYELRPGDRVDFLLHNPLDAHESDVPPDSWWPLWGNAVWALWIHTKCGHWEVLRRAKRLAESGVDVYLWPPPEPLGDMLDGRGDTLAARREKGDALVKSGPIRVRDFI